jgi:hypothetical protein
MGLRFTAVYFWKPALTWFVVLFSSIIQRASLAIQTEIAHLFCDQVSQAAVKVSATLLWFVRSWVEKDFWGPCSLFVILACCAGICVIAKSFAKSFIHRSNYALPSLERILISVLLWSHDCRIAVRHYFNHSSLNYSSTNSNLSLRMSSSLRRCWLVIIISVDKSQLTNSIYSILFARSLCLTSKSERVSVEVRFSATDVTCKRLVR